MLKRTIILVIFVISSLGLWSQIGVDIESGAVFTGYNDVRIPGDEGDKFSLKDDLSADVSPYLRIRLNYAINEKHHLSLLYAPLVLEYKGTIDRDLKFQDEIFLAESDLESTYKFNSYRITYRYDFVRRENLTFGMGFTAKIRDAIIRLENDEISSEKENVGFVPIVNFRLDWNLNKDFAIILEGDALAAPQGRAEDISLNTQYNLSDNIALRLGYRILEGGADNDEVYTFSMFHYAVFGLTYNFGIKN